MTLWVTTWLYNQVPFGIINLLSQRRAQAAKKKPWMNGTQKKYIHGHLWY